MLLLAAAFTALGREFFHAFDVGLRHPDSDPAPSLTLSPFGIFRASLSNLRRTRMRSPQMFRDQWLHDFLSLPA
ncbi:MAG: hypothetical protein CMN72_12130 [Sphingomonas sp.]|nr:hypothetical protein [Sphingomonas sp.]